MTEETKQIMEKAADDVAMLSLEEGETPWTRLQKEVQGIESKSINPKTQARFDQTKRLTLELLVDLESRNCPYVPRVAKESDRVLYAHWENQETGTRMQVFLEDDTNEVQVSGRMGLIADYEWSKGDKTQVVLCYLDLVFPSDPPGWDRLHRQINIYSAWETLPKSDRDYFDLNQKGVANMLYQLHARGCPWLPGFTAAAPGGLGLIWMNGSMDRVVYSCQGGQDHINGVTDGRFESYAPKDPVDLILEQLKLLFGSIRRQ